MRATGHGALTFLVAIVLGASAGGPQAAAPEVEDALPLLELVGTIVEVRSNPRQNGALWVEATIATGTRGDVRVRLGPADVLEREGFRLQTGESVRARVFAEQDPHDVHRIVNETTGRSVRLRCLHGDPLWDHPSQDRGGGRRHRGGAGAP